MTDSTDSARIITYHNEVLVEVQGTDEHGDIHITTYQFACGDDEQTLTPKGTLPEEHATLVQDALTAEGYKLPMYTD